MKNTKVDFGPRCPRCNKKVPPAQQSSLRFFNTGVCANCADEYNGAIRIALHAGTQQAQFILEPSWHNDNAPMRLALVTIE